MHTITDSIRCPHAECTYRSKQCHCLAAHIYDIHFGWPEQSKARTPTDPRYHRVKQRLRVIEEKYRYRLSDTAPQAKVNIASESVSREEGSGDVCFEGVCDDAIPDVLEKRAMPESLLFTSRSDAPAEEH